MGPLPERLRRRMVEEEDREIGEASPRPADESADGEAGPRGIVVPMDGDANEAPDDVPSLVAEQARRRREWRRQALGRVRRGGRRMRRGVAAGTVRAAHGWAAFVDWFNRRELSENAILLGFAVAI